MHARLVTVPEALAPLVPAWDALAVQAGLPYGAPGWMLPWWRARAPAGSALRVVVVQDGDGLAAVLPLYREGPPGRLRVWRLLGAGFVARIGPVAAPGAEEGAAAAAARLLAGPDGPDVLALEGLPGPSPWPELLAAGWPGRRPAVVEDFAMPAPTARLDDGFDAWLARRDPGTRRELRRRRRRLEEAGGVIRRAGPDELDRAVAALAACSRARWDPRGGSERLSAALEPMLLGAGRELGDRVGLWLVEHEGEPVAAHLYVRAGRELCAWGGGFVPAWGRFSPTLLLRAAALEDAAAGGVERVEFGEGAPPEKLRFADGELTLEWWTLIPRGRRELLARARLAPKHARRRAIRAAKTLPPPVQSRVRAAARAVGLD